MNPASSKKKRLYWLRLTMGDWVTELWMEEGPQVLPGKQKSISAFLGADAQFAIWGLPKIYEDWSRKEQVFLKCFSSSDSGVRQGVSLGCNFNPPCQHPILSRLWTSARMSGAEGLWDGVDLGIGRRQNYFHYTWQRCPQTWEASEQKPSARTPRFWSLVPLRPDLENYSILFCQTLPTPGVGRLVKSCSHSWITIWKLYPSDMWP